MKQTTREQWKAAVAADETTLGFLEWVRRLAYPLDQGEEEEASEVRR